MLQSRPQATRHPEPEMIPVIQPRPQPRLRESEHRPRHDARLLTEGGPEAEILLDGIRYVLRITRQGKLILTK